MPDSTIDSQITDAITQANTKILGDSPATAMGNLFVATSQALSNAAHNATANQQQSYVTAQAATTQAIATMLALDTAATGLMTEKALSAGDVAVEAEPAPPAGPLAEPTADRAILSSSPPAAEALSAAALDAAKASSDPKLTLMVLEAGALALFDAVAHLQRVSVITEVAQAQALTRALAEPNGDLWKQVMSAADHSLSQATEHVKAVSLLAINMTRHARG